jgi:radical SAM protein with 4Fe4S-binding SPASM domain
MPYHVVWLATNGCNARCVHCSSDAAKPWPDELSTAEAKGMFDQLAAAGVFDVAVSGGEPLTRPDIFEVIEYATDRGIRVGVGSNGSAINATTVNRLRACGVDRLQISIDGLEETHDRARRWPGLYRRASTAISTSIAAGLNTHVCFTAHRMNWIELEDVIDVAIGWGVRRFNLSRLVPVGRGDQTLDLNPNEWRDLTVRFESIRRERGSEIEFSTHLAQLVLLDETLSCGAGFIGCQAGVGQGCIDARGNVLPCVMLPVIAGNLRANDFETIWGTSPALEALRDRTRLEGMCGSCHVRDSCGGCRGVAFGYTGNYLATDPRCWLVANDQEGECRERRSA